MNSKINEVIDYYIDDLNKSNIDIYNQKYEYYINKLDMLDNNEPSKLLKKEHKKWEEERIIVKTEIDKIYNILIDNYKKIENDTFK